MTTIMIYKFSTLSRQEVEKMLGIEDSLQNTRFYQEAKAEGEYARSQSLVMRLLNKKIGNLNPKATEAIGQLDINQLDDLAIALLSFESIEDLNTWLKQHQ
ncbi:DUF4351 domain-containing protein [filamentous cyanobacterium LEGE 11480]|uniref:DUF4351 domain-containing protein n=1 Tax=Romeriopsis navalis LEGE 11480 TaxID=2777977 RepID=A0A928Z5V5_9CYAN|nr:DUF4351 domain-containing protein [Romeriopsis navalis LEGE 11480]